MTWIYVIWGVSNAAVWLYIFCTGMLMEGTHGKIVGWISEVRLLHRSGAACHATRAYWAE